MRSRHQLAVCPECHTEYVCTFCRDVDADRPSGGSCHPKEEPMKLCRVKGCTHLPEYGHGNQFCSDCIDEATARAIEISNR